MARLLPFLLVLLAFALMICQAAGAPTPTDEKPSLVDRTEHNMSNAQRLRRGMPLRKPDHYFDARLGPRAEPSAVP
ncbi:hypothetical protein B9479_004883 [Cryptococcus floricola]|uniref:Uncharacterized protein n=1 Tax=Cryptococcus floricola TaxID=2591691 RepID=A0A5D3AX96_9TREE|nr:hypothetical protein B9479_004883 [Cryptococcus floricola]